MVTKIWDLRQYDEQIEENKDMNEIKTIFENNGLIAIPTETVYGLGADARNEHAVKRIYKAKGRPSDNPLIVHIYKKEQIYAFTTNLTKEIETLMDSFWPGPISFIIPLKQGYLCKSVSGGLDSIAVRMPSHFIGRQILKYVDMPIAAPSANMSGRPSPTTFEHVYHDLNGRIEGIVNGDQSEEGLESTVLDCTQFPFRIARPGSITKSMIEEVIPGSVTTDGTLNHQKPIAPGMKYKHYAPDTPVQILSSFNTYPSSKSNWGQTAFIVPRNKEFLVPEEAMFIALCEDENDIKRANHNLYQILHQLDQNEKINHAYIYGFDLKDDTTAIMNRMMKAANQAIVRGEDL
ncbi:L-threonylcarbamoyladenylate synthase [Staphylococcus edaphicus]|uniref:Threonylcarbamoyl-AMP synthase n=1 Tax=Staphylococcus edaphicus TaxID=1955013 RepID=A0A2C6WLS9_9STAP|nr:L-threonylcarbamoyladenylate synthase [Staphylococcus edaphicus]PHK49103.1 threonylcarbamoyl-AMP synthase [Staphylococcus edaphicus]UQW82292.1 threonylcarbamoyl-AMP synthase [Staphylococcus edaphicus]